MSPKLTVRPFEAKDIEPMVAYWTNNTAADLERMGVDASQVTPAEVCRQRISKLVGMEAHGATAYYLVWEVDGLAVGFSFLAEIVAGKSANVHLHMWEPANRGKGFGGKLFCLAAIEFYRLYDLATMFCEPRAENPMPNRMLQKIGFPIVKSYVGRSSPVTVECNLNRYEISLDVAQRFLEH